jgi:RNA polymerase sigma-70 factor (ECF subfamily)
MPANLLAGLVSPAGEALGSNEASQEGAFSMDRAFSGDSDAFAAFYQRSARPLWAYLARVSGDPTLADDLMQEAYIRFLGAVGAPSLAEGEIAQRRYLYRIATNLLRDYWRKPRPASIEELPESLFSIGNHAGQHETNALLAPAMAQMKPRERQLLWLAHAEGYSHREIAEITGLASPSIRLLLFRARRKIAALLHNPADKASTLPAAAARRQP